MLLRRKYHWLLTLGVVLTSFGSSAEAQDGGRRRLLPPLFPHRHRYYVPMENVVPQEQPIPTGPVTVDEARQTALDATFMATRSSPPK